VLNSLVGEKSFATHPFDESARFRRRFPDVIK